MKLTFFFVASLSNSNITSVLAQCHSCHTPVFLGAKNKLLLFLINVVQYTASTRWVHNGLLVIICNVSYHFVLQTKYMTKLCHRYWHCWCFGEQTVSKNCSNKQHVIKQVIELAKYTCNYLHILCPSCIDDDDDNVQWFNVHLKAD